MNAAKHAVWLFLCMIALACSGWYFSSSEAIIRLDDLTLSETPDSILTDLTVRQYSPTGLLTSFLESPEMRSIPRENTHLMKLPHVVFHQKNQSAWEIHAEKAHSINKGEQITFMNNVIIHQAKSLHNQESTLRTETLTYFPKKKFATTTLAVSFAQPGSIVHSIGMNAYLNNKHVQLLSKTRATYEPGNA